MTSQDLLDKLNQQPTLLFWTFTVNLAQERRLDPDDPKADTKVAKRDERKGSCSHSRCTRAREKHQELLKAAQKEGNVLAKYFYWRRQARTASVEN